MMMDDDMDDMDEDDDADDDDNDMPTCLRYPTP